MKMERIPNTHYILILVIILAGIFAYNLYNNYSNITGFFTGDLRVNIRSSVNYFNESIVIVNGTTIDTGLNASLNFNINGTSQGFINITAENNNPTSNAFTEKAAINKFLIIESNLTFQNATITFKYSDSELGNLDESSLMVYHFSNVTGDWEVLPGYVNADLNEVYGITTNFSIFGVFGNYALQPSAPTSGTGGGGGAAAAGGAAEIKSDFTVIPQIITTTLLQEQGKSLDVQIKNTGNKKIDIKIEVQDLSEFAIISESDFALDVGETKIIRLDLFALSEQKPGIYIGKIVIKGISTQTVINVVIEVKERKPLFDIRINVLPEYKKVVAGGGLFALINLENIGLRGKLVDVSLYLKIMDLDKKILFEASKETIAVGTSLSTIREFQIPSYMPAGKYLLISEIKYDSITIAAYDTFDIVEEIEKVAEIEKPKPTFGITSLNPWIIAIMIAITVIAVAVFLLYRKIKSLRITSPEIKSEKEIDKERNKLRKQLKILAESFKESFVKKGEYMKRKNKIKDKLNKLDEELEKIKEEKIEYSEDELAVFRKEKNRLIDELNRLDEAYTRGVIEKKGYEKTRKVLIKKIDKLKEELGER